MVSISHSSLTFVADVHLGKLAKYLRMLGFDTRFNPEWNDRTLLHIAAADGRILLSRDRLLVESAPPIPAYLVRNNTLREQLDEVLQAFNFPRIERPLTICLDCNTLLDSVTKEEVFHRLPAYVREGMHEFWMCRRCDKVLWKGSHYDRMVEFVAAISRASLAGSLTSGTRRPD